MKSQIQKKKKNFGITNRNIFPKKCFSWGDKNFFGRKNYGEVVLIGGLMIRSCEGLGGVS